jgi:hypothetical protein
MLIVEDRNNRHQFFYYTTATIFLRYYNTFTPESNQIYSKVNIPGMSVYGYILQKNRVGRSDFHFILFYTEIPDCGPIRPRKRYRTLEYIWLLSGEAKKKYMSVYGYPTDPIFSGDPSSFYQ